MKFIKRFSRRQLLKTSLFAGSGLLLSGKINFRMLETNLLKRKIPATGEELPVVGLGTWQTFDVGDNAAERAALKAVLALLIKSGASMVDSSPMYGSSETVVGDLCEDLKARKSLFLATKVWTSGRQAGIDQMSASIRKMKAGAMDLMQVHNLVDVDTHLKTLADWKAQGKVRYVGITHYTTGSYPELMQHIRTGKLDFVQFNYNVGVREAEKTLLPLAQEKGAAVIVNRPFEEGDLFQKVKGKTLPDWAADYEIRSWGQFFLKYILSHPAVTCVIPGTSKAFRGGHGRVAG
jgi:diketogulonate reductase-like aldo/keto reductase